MLYYFLLYSVSLRNASHTFLNWLYDPLSYDCLLFQNTVLFQKLQSLLNSVQVFVEWVFWINDYYVGRHFSALLTEWGTQGRTGKGVPGDLLKVTIIRIMIANQCSGTKF